MTDIRILAGSFGEGAANYEDGVFRLPNGDVRGVEDLTDLGAPAEPAPEPHWSGDIVRGLQGALATGTKGLPSPFGFAASFVGIGLDAIDPSAKGTTNLSLVFSDGAAATLAADRAVAEVIRRDREVIRLALLRRPPAPLSPPAPAPSAPEPPVSEPSISKTSISKTSISKTSISEPSIVKTSISETSTVKTSISEPSAPATDPADPTLTSMFQYEKRKGRLRRVASEKVPEEG